ncbi:hypothetical protein MSG28_015948 [Choristoneura fumiferana]|uniref:Uncharacterized protein n=1 Tax=Choristoneura fumiferana TaxID=7141 RepID=A0ACC0K4X4_CHOFU|nr:hypothetical protein MSG28_015948 [Choristoneura fumiferana]
MSPDPPTTGASTTIELSSISLSSRIPEFWQDQPRLWFYQVEAILAQQKASDQANYNVVIAKLGKQVIQQIADILEKPPEQNKFDTLKKRLLHLYEETETKRLRKLMTEMDLGDQRPSQLLRRMLDLARDKLSEDAVFILWQEHLPQSVRAVLACADSKNLDSLGNIADKVMETLKPNEVAEFSQSTSRQSPTKDPIFAELAKINARIDGLARSRGRSKSRGRFSGKGHSRSRARSSNKVKRTPESPDWLCYYHFRFKTKAKKCVQPCSWKGHPPAGN